MDTSSSILRSAKQFFAGTFFSRISGLLRDLTMAACFGSAPEIGAFMVAYRLANLFRRLIGEGNLQSGFVPYFESLRGEDPKGAFLFYRDSVFSLSIVLLLLVGAIEGTLGFWRGYLEGSWHEIATLAMWMAPGLLFICLASLGSALLHCQKRYFASAIAPVVFNGVWISAAFMARHLPLAEGVRLVSMGVTLAFGAQWLLTFLQSQKEVRSVVSGPVWFSPRLFSPQWRQIIKPMALGVAGVGAMQINSTLDAFFAHAADPSGPAYLWYAIRVQQLPLALFGIALSGALLPPLARAMQGDALEKYRELLLSALRQGAAFMIPCTIALFVLGASGVNLLYGRGAFTSEALRETLFCLWAYSLGLLPAVFVLLLATGFYAKKAYRIPTIASLISVGAHVAMNLLFIFGLHLGSISIALATSGSAWLNFWLLARQHKVGTFFWIGCWKIALGSFLAGGLALILGHLLGDGTEAICSAKAFSFSRSPVTQLIQFGVMTGTYAGSLLGVMKLFGWKSPRSIESGIHL